jgi:uncharacterized protein
MNQCSEVEMNRVGIGLGLRTPHYNFILENNPKVSWFEAISENYMETAGGSGGRSIAVLEKVRSVYPVVLHGVSLSIGSTDDLNFDYMNKLKRLISRIEPSWVSDHLCWTGVLGENMHDLLPLPYTEEVIKHLVERIHRVQEFLGREMVFENVSAYLSYKHSEMPEWEFIKEIAKRTGCGLLLDVNNVYVSSVNQNFRPLEFFKALPAEKIKQMHLAGHSRSGECLIDTHDAPVADPVWDLYGEAVRMFGKVPTLIEWDDKIPEFSVLQAEASRAKQLQERFIGKVRENIIAT